MKLAGRAWRLAALGALGLLQACQPLANQSDLAPSLIPAASVCPAQLNFEPPATLQQWDAPPWTLGFDSWALDSDVAYCGLRSLRVRGKYSGASTFVYLYRLFDGQQNLVGKTVQARVYLPQTPPADLAFRVEVMDILVNGAGTATLTPLAQGWNTVTLAVTNANAATASGLRFQIVRTSAALYQTDLWIDEVSW